MFQGTIQVVLQRPDANHALVCECFAHVPSPWPSLISVVSVGGNQAEHDSDRVGKAISRILRSVTGRSAIVPAPCDPSSKGPVDCRARKESGCRRILVLVGDGSRPFDNDRYGAIKLWTQEIANGNDKFFVIPCLPQTLESQAKNLLANYLGKIEAQFWTSDPADVAPLVLSRAGITVEDNRLFVSYRREDGQVLADQLFDALNRRNYDVFLDRYCIDAGINFQERVMEELAHKSMVVVLETPKCTASNWVREEVVYAATNHLGLLAVQVPQGRPFAEIKNFNRMMVQTTTSGELTPQWLDRVCQRIGFVHSVAMMKRRHRLRQAMRNALLNEGVVQQQMVSNGFLEARPAGNTSGTPYSVWLTPRPADLADFHYVNLELGTISSPRPVVVAPAVSMVGRRSSSARWLGKISNVHLFDEADIVEAARKIGKGTL